MGRKTAIDWCDATWNPWYGCQKVSAGCKHCYAQRDMLRFGKNFDVVTKAKDGTFFAPDKWTDEPLIIFVCSWSDFFIEDADFWRDEAWEIIRRNPQHIFLLLTKRIERVEMCLPDDWGEGYPNVWLGVSVANKDEVYRLPLALEIPAALHFISAEPLVGEIEIFEYLYKGGFRPGYKWVIVGGESGVGTEWRDLKIEWVDKTYQDCQNADVAFFFKQWAGRKKKGVVNNRYKGQVIHEMPENTTLEPKQDALF
jgi:protein gp37